MPPLGLANHAAITLASSHFPGPWSCASNLLPPASLALQVLLSTSDAPLNGFANAGLLHAGSGYWAQEQDLPNGGLSDFAVRCGPSAAC